MVVVKSPSFANLDFTLDKNALQVFHFERSIGGSLSLFSSFTSFLLDLHILTEAIHSTNLVYIPQNELHTLLLLGILPLNSFASVFLLPVCS